MTPFAWKRSRSCTAHCTGERQRRNLPRGRITLTFAGTASQPALLTERDTHMTPESQIMLNIDTVMLNHTRGIKVLFPPLPFHIKVRPNSLASELFLIALQSSKCYSSTPTVILCFHNNKLFYSRTFDNIAQTSPDKIYIMHMNRLNRRAGSGSCMTVLLQYNYTRAYRNENVSKRRFTFSPLILNTSKLHGENDAWLLAVTADECTRKNEIHWTTLSSFQSTSASLRKARRKERIISLLHFTPSVSHQQ